jgi:hypothetical protein
MHNGQWMLLMQLSEQRTAKDRRRTAGSCDEYDHRAAGELSDILR